MPRDSINVTHPDIFWRPGHILFLIHYKRVQTLLLVEDQEDGDMLKLHSCSTEDTFRTYGMNGI
jgi:hypothetical protein